MKRLSLVGLAAATFISVTSYVHAEESVEDVVESPPLVVTATRTAVTQDEALAAVTTIEREEIETSGAVDLLDLLQAQPGLNIAQTGGLGSQTSVFIRGSNSDQTLVLIDGVRVNNTTNGLFTFEHLPANQIERIEIVRGPRGAIYGSDALGGVIQIFTRRGEGGSLELGAGKYGTRRYAAGLSGGDSFRYNLQVQHLEADGFDATTSGNAPDDDGNETTSGNLGLQLDLSDATTIGLTALYTTSENEFDGFFAPDSFLETDTATVSLFLDTTFNDIWSASFRLGGFDQQSESFSPAPGSVFESQRYSFDWQNDLQLSARDLVSVGISAEQESGRSANAGTATVAYDEDTTQYAAYLQWQGERGKASWQIAARHDQHSEYGGFTTGHVAGGWAFNDRQSIFASVGSSFKAPSMSELFSPGCCGGLFAGNPDLDPEESLSYELGLKHQANEIVAFGLNLFHTEFKNLIAFQGTNSQAINVAHARNSGIEFTTVAKTEKWRMAGSISVIRTRDDNNDELLRRPEGKLALQVVRSWQQGTSVGVEWTQLSSWQEFAGAAEGYGLVNTFADIQILDMLVLNLRLENVFDENYERAAGFETARRGAYGTLKLEF